jgi:hypothetical protein
MLPSCRTNYPGNTRVCRATEIGKPMRVPECICELEKTVSVETNGEPMLRLKPHDRTRLFFVNRMPAS